MPLRPPGRGEAGGYGRGRAREPVCGARPGAGGPGVGVGGLGRGRRRQARASGREGQPWVEEGGVGAAGLGSRKPSRSAGPGSGRGTLGEGSQPGRDILGRRTWGERPWLGAPSWACRALGKPGRVGRHERRDAAASPRSGARGGGRGLSGQGVLAWPSWFTSPRCFFALGHLASLFSRPFFSLAPPLTASPGH